MPGPLSGTTVVELAGIGPGPHACMMLADMGATVIRVEPPGGRSPGRQQFQPLSRSRRSIVVDVKSPAGREVVLKLVERADALVEGFRPGVTEKLGVGPDACLARNPRLVYGRMTGWGQTGPYAKWAGHDINYISLSGALHAIGPKGGKPVPPLNLVGDFGGGGMLMAFGVVCGVVEARRSGKGQVIDASMVEGSAALLAPTYGGFAAGGHRLERGSNMLDSGSPFYDTYETKDGKYISIGSIEAKFYRDLLRIAGLEDVAELAPQLQMKPKQWPRQKELVAAAFRTKTRDEWCALMEHTDVCFAPVLSMAEAPGHPHNVARESFVNVGGVVQPAPAPRFSRTPPPPPAAPPRIGEHTREVLGAYAGLSAAEIDALLRSGAVAESDGRAKL